MNKNIKDYDNLFDCLSVAEEDVKLAEHLFDYQWVNDGEFSALVHPKSTEMEKYQVGKTDKLFADSHRRIPRFSSSEYLHLIILQLAEKGWNISLQTDESLKSLLYSAKVYDPKNLHPKRQPYQSGSTPEEACVSAILYFLNV